MAESLRHGAEEVYGAKGETLIPGLATRCPYPASTVVFMFN